LDVETPDAVLVIPGKKFVGDEDFGTGSLPVALEGEAAWVEFSSILIFICSLTCTT